MLKRIVIYCISFLALLLLVAGYFYFEDRRIRAESAKKSEPFIADEIAQIKGLQSLGTVSIDPANLTLARLQEGLHTPAIKKPGSRNTTRLGWACGKERCAIWASLLVPAGEEIPPSTPVAALSINGTASIDLPNISVGGIHLNESTDDAEKFCQKRGSEPPVDRRWRRWDSNWKVAWGAVNGRIGLLFFVNDRLLDKTERQEKLD